MSKILKKCLAMAAVLVVPCVGLTAEPVVPASAPPGAAQAGVDGTAAVAAPVAVVVLAEPARVAASPRLQLMGVAPLDRQRLAQRRGAADVFNDMQLRGVVADNRAINVSTGSNLITEGSFSGASGVPMVVQNSGNNVLIQNATILNVQVK